jgi:hypothetical protein
MPKKNKAFVRRTGLSACPMNEGFVSVLDYFRSEMSDADISHILKEYVSQTYSKEDSRLILSNPEYKFSMFSAYSAAIHYAINSPLDLPEQYRGYPKRIREYTDSLLKEAKDKILVEPEVIKRVPVKVLMERKVNSTVLVDIDEMLDEWINGEETTRDLYSLFKIHDLKPSAVPMVEVYVRYILSEHEDAINGTCEDAVEAYSSVSKKEMNRRINVLHEMIKDLNRSREVGKSKRKARTKKTISSDRLVAKLNYSKESTEYKVVSIAPTMIINAFRLYCFNEKTRVLTEYVADGPTGLSIKGSTLTGFSEESSRSTKLRKPLEVLPEILSKTPRQINTLWSKLSTKSSVPTGRINLDTVLLRAMNK